MNSELVKDKIETHDKMLDDHSVRIKNLEANDAMTNIRMNNLCEKLEAQTKSINWLIGILVTSLLGFFFFIIQQGSNLIK